MSPRVEPEPRIGAGDETGERGRRDRVGEAGLPAVAPVRRRFADGDQRPRVSGLDHQHLEPPDLRAADEVVEVVEVVRRIDGSAAFRGLVGAIWRHVTSVRSIVAFGPMIGARSYFPAGSLL